MRLYGFLLIFLCIGSAKAAGSVIHNVVITDQNYAEINTCLGQQLQKYFDSHGIQEQVTAVAGVPHAEWPSHLRIFISAASNARNYFIALSAIGVNNQWQGNVGLGQFQVYTNSMNSLAGLLNGSDYSELLKFDVAPCWGD